MERFFLPRLADRIFQERTAVADIFAAGLLGSVEMSQRRVVKLFQDRYIHIIYTAHTEQLRITGFQTDLFSGPAVSSRIELMGHDYIALPGIDLLTFKHSLNSCSITLRHLPSA